MIQFENLKQYDKIYIVDFDPLTILCLDLLGVFYRVCLFILALKCEVFRQSR